MAIALLCEIIAQGGRASAEAYRDRPGYAALIQSGLLRESGVVQSVACVDCVAPHDAEVVHHGGWDGYWCPDLGFVRLDRTAVTGLAPDLTVLVAKLADAFMCKRRKSSPVHGSTWRIGAVETPAGDLTIYLHPRLLNAQDMQEAETAIRVEVRSAFTVLLTAVGSLQRSGTVTAPLCEVVDLDPRSDALTPLADLRAAVGASPKPQGGAPNVFGHRLRTVVAAREQNGEALAGRNEEARAVLEAFRHAHPGEQAPSLSNVRRYVTEVRSGS